jgi:hypothetical protein
VPAEKAAQELGLHVGERVQVTAFVHVEEKEWRWVGQPQRTTVRGVASDGWEERKGRILGLASKRQRQRNTLLGVHKESTYMGKCTEALGLVGL